MILVDSSVWISQLHGRSTPGTSKFRASAVNQNILVGDLILLEVLQGARDDLHAARIERELRRYRIVPMLDGALAVRAAHNYRMLRNLGITVRKTADIIIGTFCIENGHVLLHDDRDFEPMERHLGLKIA